MVLPSLRCPTGALQKVLFAVECFRVVAEGGLHDRAPSAPGLRKLQREHGIEKNRIDVALTDEVLADRAAQWKRPPYKFTRGTLYKYIKMVKNASEGCVTDE